MNKFESACKKILEDVNVKDLDKKLLNLGRIGDEFKDLLQELASEYDSEFASEMYGPMSSEEKAKMEKDAAVMAPLIKELNKIDGMLDGAYMRLDNIIKGGIASQKKAAMLK